MVNSCNCYVPGQKYTPPCIIVTAVHSRTKHMFFSHYVTTHWGDQKAYQLPLCMPYLELMQPVEIAFKNHSVQAFPSLDLWKVICRLQFAAIQDPRGCCCRHCRCCCCVSAGCSTPFWDRGHRLRSEQRAPLTSPADSHPCSHNPHHTARGMLRYSQWLSPYTPQKAEGWSHSTRS